MSRVFLSIGSNLGDRVENCRKAIERVSDASEITFVRVSPFYETSPWGVSDQPEFVNCAVEVKTALAPRKLLETLKKIETAIGRKAGTRWRARLIDLDIILYKDMIIEEQGLVIPHPYAHERGFVLVPLADIAPEVVHPVFKRSISELLLELKDAGFVKRLEDVC